MLQKNICIIIESSSIAMFVSEILCFFIYHLWSKQLQSHRFLWAKQDEHVWIKRKKRKNEWKREKKKIETRKKENKYFEKKRENLEFKWINNNDKWSEVIKFFQLFKIIYENIICKNFMPTFRLKNNKFCELNSVMSNY